MIGVGTAGLVTAAETVELIELELMGGDCLNVGCIPSKGVIRAARVAVIIPWATYTSLEIAQVVIYEQSPKDTGIEQH